ncbi:MAG: extracellular solute-binding protein, partial [Acholeplasmatales bacterium]
YRTDILAELGLKAPTTWDEVIEIVPILQRYNLEFFLPQTPTAMNPLFYAMVKQRGGHLYEEDGRRVALLDEAGIVAFEQFANFYADYSFTVAANFPNRFRSGEMPIGISYYVDYNLLSVFAPEIRGQWEFVELPGTLQSDGSIDNTSVGISNAVVLLNDSEHKEAGWEYMKWWTDTATQVRFAREMEGILGAAARYPTANIEALSQLPWPAREYRVLAAQAHNTAGIPVVPGSYITGRYLDNAFRAVINNGMNPRESLFDNVTRINAELQRKRVEFGLD